MNPRSIHCRACGLILKTVFVLLAGLCLKAHSQGTLVFPLNGGWRYSTNSHDAIPSWRSTAFAETGWSNSSPALLYIESAALPGPKNTPLPERAGGGPVLTYYFRTTFNLADASAVVSLTFSNLLDDGAVFYLNGVEVQRVGMAAGAVTYSTTASRAVGDATSFDVFTISGDLLTNLVTGANVVAVEVHQQAATSSDIVFGCAMIASTGETLTRTAYLQNGSHTNITVRWRTDLQTDSRVRYGTNLANLDLTNDVAATVSDHVVTLTSLLPDTKYFYSIGRVASTLAGPDANHFFVTSPLPGTIKNTRIWVLGDSGTATAGQMGVRDAYQTFTGARHTDLWLMLGDNAYNSGTDSEYQSGLFNIYTDMLPKSVLWPALGNHDTGQATSFVNTYPYFDIFTLPKNGEAGGVASGTEHYYSFDYANIHFICLDSMTAGRATNNAMYLWLTNDLANVTATWTIAFFHHPPYTKGSHDSDTESELIEMRQVFLPVLEQGGVDLVLAGHSHCYERSILLDKHYGSSVNLSNYMKLDVGTGRENDTGAYKKNLFDPIAHQGTVYAVVGSSGQATGGSLNHPAMKVSLNNLGSLVLDINGNRLDGTFIRETAATNDTFTIQKLSSTTSLRILSTLRNGLGHCTITWASVGGLRYRVSYRDGDPNGTFTDIVRSLVEETDVAAHGKASVGAFTDDLSLTGGIPAGGTRYFRVRVVP